MFTRSRPRSRLALPACLFTLLISAPLLASEPATDTAPRQTVVVTTSLLENAARELLPPDGPVAVVSLVPPGTCPGHFDLSPRLVPELRAALVVARHDFQVRLDDQLRRVGVEEASVVVVRGRGSLLIPGHYLDLVRQVERALSRRLPDRRADLAAALGRVEARVASLEAEVRGRPAPWAGAPVIASSHQAELCSWLGLEVVAELGRAEDTTPRELEGLLAGGPALVVGNLQEGPQAALVLGERLGRPVAVLSNFPNAPGYGSTYDDLLRANLDRLDGAWADR